jgi:mannose-6-phosphate isomerase-like protein (cupin superfamily)
MNMEHPAAVVDLADCFDRIHDLWSPKIVAQVGETQVKLARVRGTFDWHAHGLEDELFFVHSGRLKLEFRDREVWLEAGQMFRVPAGVEHRPLAPEEVQLVLIEPAGTRNTGDRETDRTVEAEWL